MFIAVFTNLTSSHPESHKSCANPQLHLLKIKLNNDFPICFGFCEDVPSYFQNVQYARFCRPARYMHRDLDTKSEILIDKK